MFMTNHVFKLPGDLGGLYCSVNCYRPKTHQCDLSSPCDGIVLVFAHCTSTHKEQWEPCIQKLFDLGQAMPGVEICEAWALDCTNHGDSAILNKTLLSDETPVSVKDYASLLRHFVDSPFLTGRSKVVGVGHSSSTSAWTLAIALNSLPELSPHANLSSVILVEPVMVPPPFADPDPRIEIGKRNVQGVLSRRDRWSGLDEVRTWLLKRFPYRTWDPRIIDLYLKHGFHSVEDTPGTSHTTYKCKLAQEVGFYTPEDHVLAGELTAMMCSCLPVHCVFGERPEMVSLKSRQIICDEDRGRKMSSVSTVPSAGHLAVQENPDGVARAVFGILCNHSLLNRLSVVDTIAKAAL